MKASTFTDAQKAFVIKQGEEGTPVAEICRKAGISQATYFNWKKKYAGLMPSEMRRLRELDDKNGGLKRIKDICETHVRYGYRRVYYVLHRDGWVVNMKKVYRLYREQGLQLRNKTPKRHVKAKLREDRAPAIRPNDVWAMDFVHDQLATGRNLRILTVVDTFSRLSPVVGPRFSYSGEDVVALLERACRKIGYPKTKRVYKGSELVSQDMDLWAYQRGVILDYSRPGKPTDNAFIEAFNSKLRSES